MRVPLAALGLVLFALSACLAHDDFSHVFSKRYGLGDPNAQCWTKPFPSNTTAVPAPCPDGLNINFTYTDWPEDFFIDSVYPIEFKMTVQLPDISSVPDIPHANVHGCVQAAGFCSPILAQQPGLVSFYGQATANLTNNGTAVVTSPVQLSSVGIWSLICHGRVVRGVAPNRVQIDFAYGTSITVKRHIPKISKGALIAIGVIAGLVAAASVVLLVAIIVYRKHKVIRAATFPFCVIMLIGGVVALGTIIPLGYSPVTDKTCVAIPWLLAPATCLTLCLLTLRLYRVQVLFGKAALHPDMERYWYLRNHYLLLAAIAVTSTQIVMLIIWSAIPDWRPRQVIENRDITIGYGCGSNNPHAMPGLYWTFVAMDALILGAAVVLAFLTRKVTTLFNESKAIALITYTFVFIGFVIIPIQKLVSDVTGIFVLRAMGIIMGVGSAIVLLFAPKFYIIFTTNKRDLRGVDLTGSQSVSTTSSGDFDTGSKDVAMAPRSAEQKKPDGDAHLDKKTIDRLDAATQRAVTLLEKHKTGFRVGPNEMQEVINGLKAV